LPKAVVEALMMAAYRKVFMKTTKIKQKILMPTLKERQRYLVYKVIFAGDVLANHLATSDVVSDFRKIHESIIDQCIALMGIFDSAAAGIIGVSFNPRTQKGIIRVNNKYVDKLKVCLGMIRQSDVKNTAVNTPVNTSVNSRNNVGMVFTVDCCLISGMIHNAQDFMDKI
jgi:RNase P/RNase MRP subunit POP5